VAFLRFDSDIASFMYQQFLGEDFQKQLLRKKVVGAQPGIYLGDISSIPILVPHADEQTKIADFLSAIDRKIESVATQITETQTFKRGLLQQMFV
jgi:type I restriction enzyme S subunit